MFQRLLNKEISIDVTISVNPPFIPGFNLKFNTVLDGSKIEVVTNPNYKPKGEYILVPLPFQNLVSILLAEYCQKYTPVPLPKYILRQSIQQYH